MTGRWTIPFAIALGLICTYIALDGHMYWHEGRLLYAVTHFSLGELTAGSFNPNQLGAEIDVLGSSGYHATKLLYLASLKALTTLPVGPDSQLLIGSLLSLLSLFACAWCVRGVMRKLGAAQAVANASAAAFLLMPLVPYLGGKVLSEVVALLPAFVALRLWPRDPPDNFSGIARLLFAGVLVAVTALARLDVVIIHIAYVCAALLTDTSQRKHRQLLLHGSVAAVAVAFYVTVLQLADIGVASMYRYFIDYLSLSPKSLAMSLFGVASFGGLMWIFAALGLRAPSALSRFLTIWLLLTAAPIIAIVANYMVEPRYLAAASLPFAGLAGRGLAHCFELCRGTLQRGWLGAGLAAIAGLNAIPVALMPYEIDRNAILKAADEYAPEDQSTALLVPWSYSDYHFLRFARPSSNILNVHTPEGDPAIITPDWDKRLRTWYGARYVTDPATIESRLMGGGALYYLGWGPYPPISTVSGWADAIGLEPLGRQLAAFGGQEHQVQSWMWNSAAYTFEPIARRGQYTVYEVSSAR